MATASTKLSQIRHHMSKQRIMHVSTEPAQFRQGRKKAQEHPHQPRSTNRTTHAPIMLEFHQSRRCKNKREPSANPRKCDCSGTTPASTESLVYPQSWASTGTTGTSIESSSAHRTGPAQAPHERTQNYSAGKPQEHVAGGQCVFRSKSI